MPNIPGMTPEIAEAARDVLALVRAALETDTQAMIVIIGPLSREDAIQRLVSMAGLTANLMRTEYGEEAVDFMSRFAQENLIY